MSKKTLALLAVGLSMVLVAVGQILLKESALRHRFERLPDLAPLMLNPWALTGMLVYALGWVAWLYGVAHLPFYFVTLATVSSCVLLVIAAFVLYGERPTALQWMGIGAVLVGLALIGSKTT